MRLCTEYWSSKCLPQSHTCLTPNTNSSFPVTPQCTILCRTNMYLNVLCMTWHVPIWNIYCSLLAGFLRLTRSPCDLWVARGGTAALHWCPAPRPRLTCHTWRRTPGSCGAASSTSGKSGDARRTNFWRWRSLFLIMLLNIMKNKNIVRTDLNGHCHSLTCYTSYAGSCPSTVYPHTDTLVCFSCLLCVRNMKLRAHVCFCWIPPTAEWEENLMCHLSFFIWLP